MNIDHFLKMAVEKRASDIHFSSNEPVRIRVDGDLVPIEGTSLGNDELQTLLFEMLTDAEKERAINGKNLDKSLAFGDLGFFRVNIFWTRKGVAAVLRTIPSRIPTLADLALPDSVRTLSEAAKGLVLVTGPTGSGKSTTLAAMINHININFPYHILTAEDPVEFVHPSKKCLINQREIGASCNTFADALKYALREDPDVILVGEMRDLETIGLALTAAETGHLVFGTLHTRGAGASVDRIIDSFPANQQAMIRTMLSESLIGVVSQALIKRADGKGRVAAFEIMVVNHAIANLIREGKTFQMASIMQTARKEGMLLMDAHIVELVENNIVTPEEAATYMEDGSKLLAAKKYGKPGATAIAPTPKPLGAAKAPAVPGAKPPIPTPAKPAGLKPLTAPPVFTRPPVPGAAAKPAPAAPAPIAAAPTPPPTAAAIPIAVEDDLSSVMESSALEQGEGEHTGAEISVDASDESLDALGALADLSDATNSLLISTNGEDSEVNIAMSEEDVVIGEEAVAEVPAAAPAAAPGVAVSRATGPAPVKAMTAARPMPSMTDAPLKAVPPAKPSAPAAAAPPPAMKKGPLPPPPPMKKKAG